MENRITESADDARDEVMRTAHEIALAVNSTLDLDQVLHLFFERVMSLLGAEGGSLVLVDAGANELVFRLVHGGADGALIGRRMPAGRGVVGWVIERNESLLVPDVTQDERWYRQLDAVTRFTTHSLLAVPICTRDRVLGAIEFVNRQDGRPFAESDLRLLELFAASAATAIENAQLYRDLQAHTAELEKTNAELKKLDRLKTEFVQNISHELRTPLTFIKGYVELLRTGDLGELPERAREGADIIAEQTNTLIKLVNRILSLQAVESSAPRLGVVDLNALAQSAVRDARAAARQAGLELRVESEPDVPQVAGDVEQLGEVFSNLLSNAIKFSPPGSEVWVRVKPWGDRVQVAVQDHGIGISAEEQEKVFDRFYQVDGSPTRRYEGAGLGLAIIKRIVEAHRGQIWVDSALNRGSTFYFAIPKVAP